MDSNQFNYAKRGTTVHPKALIVTYRPAAEPGHSRSTPQGVGTPMPAFREKQAKFKELPQEPGATAIPNEPATEPESMTTLGPTSHL